VINGGAIFEIREEAQIHVQINSHAIFQLGACNIIGGGNVSVDGIYECAHIVTHFNPFCHIRPKAWHLVSGLNGSHICAPGNQLLCHSCLMNTSNTGTQYTHVVGCDSCNLPASIEHVCDIPGSCTPSYVYGGNFWLMESGSIHVQISASLFLNGTVQVSGFGLVFVEGTMQHEAQYISNCSHLIEGKHSINMGFSIFFGKLAYSSNAHVVMVAGPSGFIAISISGSVVFGGSLTLQTNGFVPSGLVTLMTYASFSGNFSSVASDSATKGFLQYNANSLVWYPSGTTCSGRTTVN